MIDISGLSRRYDVRRLGESDADEILQLCQANALYYQYCQAEPSREQVLSDLRVAPPGKDLSDKYYVGFYRDETLVAVMDLIDGFPQPDMGYIGFFMMNAALQGKQIGTAIIGEAAAYLKSAGMRAIRLAIAKDNPQATHFWQKNGFAVIREADMGGWTALVAEKTL